MRRTTSRERPFPGERRHGIALDFMVEPVQMMMMALGAAAAVVPYDSRRGAQLGNYVDTTSLM